MTALLLFVGSRQSVRAYRTTPWHRFGLDQGGLLNVQSTYHEITAMKRHGVRERYEEEPENATTSSVGSGDMSQSYHEPVQHYVL